MKNLKVLTFLACFSLANIAFALPQGSYLRTCHGCVQIFQALYCTCNNNANLPNAASLEVPINCAFVENINGQLQCTHLRNDKYSRWRRHHRRRRRHHRPHHRPNKHFLNAGPIWSQLDAGRKCPNVCRDHNGRWTRQWKTTIPGQMSACECKIKSKVARMKRSVIRDFHF